jgi:prepilin-type N-terminal cleavage/methylation domain-containing protein
MKTNNKGFTLIELLVVIAIITILATISIPQFAKYRVRAYNVVALSDLRNYKVDFEAYYTDIGNLGYPTSIVSLNEEATSSWVTSDQIKQALTNGTYNASLSFIPSNNVDVYYNVGGTVANNPQIYIIGTKHTNGNTVYASSSHTSRIYARIDPAWVGQSGGQTGVTMPTITPTDSKTYDDRAFASPWQAM